MAGLAGAHQGAGGRDHDDRRNLAFLIFAGLAVLFVAIVVVAVTSTSVTDKPSRSTAARESALRKLPPYWKVHSGDTYGLIAQKTGLTVDELETFNPYVDPSAIVPGQRLKLRAHVPAPKRRLGPRTWKVRSGESFGSIAAKTGKDITRLMRLNPKLKPSKLQPGDRVRLR